MMIYTWTPIFAQCTSDQVAVTVNLDPRVTDVTEQDVKDLGAAYDNLATMMDQANAAFNKLKKAKKKVELIEKLTETVQDTTKKAMTELNKATKKQLEDFIISYVDKENLKGIQRNPTTLNRVMGTAQRYLRSSYGKPTPNAQIAIDKAEKAVTKSLAAIEAFFAKDWVAYQEKVEAMEFDLFGIDHLDVQVEYNKVRPFTYAHRSFGETEIPIASFSHQQKHLIRTF